MPHLWSLVSDFTTVRIQQVAIWPMEGLVGWLAYRPTDNLYRSASQERFYDAHYRSKSTVGLKRPSVHRGCSACLLASLCRGRGVCLVSWSLQLWRSAWTNCGVQDPPAGMDLAGYHPQLPQPLVHHPGSYPDNEFNSEGSSTCECRMDVHLVELVQG